MSTAAERLRARLAAVRKEKQMSEAPVSEAPQQTPEPEQPIQPAPASVVSTDNIPDEAVGFKNMLLELEDKLNNRVDNFPYLLRDIHQHLRRDPEIVTVLSDEEIGLIVRGIKTMTGTVLGTTAAAKKTGGRAKKSMPVTADML